MRRFILTVFVTSRLHLVGCISWAGERGLNAIVYLE